MLDLSTNEALKDLSGPFIVTEMKGVNVVAKPGSAIVIEANASTTILISRLDDPNDRHHGAWCDNCKRITHWDGLICTVCKRGME